MIDETATLAGGLHMTKRLLMQMSPAQGRHVARNYQEAHLLVATILLDDGNARTQIDACYAGSDLCEARQDIGCLGWQLMATEIRVKERNLRDWETLHKLVIELVAILMVGETRLH